jgi:hypothetical protein
MPGTPTSRRRAAVRRGAGYAGTRDAIAQEPWVREVNPLEDLLVHGRSSESRAVAKVETLWFGRADLSASCAAASIGATDRDVVRSLCAVGTSARAPRGAERAATSDS